MTMAPMAMAAAGRTASLAAVRHQVPATCATLPLTACVTAGRSVLQARSGVLAARFRWSAAPCRPIQLLPGLHSLHVRTMSVLPLAHHGRPHTLLHTRLLGNAAWASKSSQTMAASMSSIRSCHPTTLTKTTTTALLAPPAGPPLAQPARIITNRSYRSRRDSLRYVNKTRSWYSYLDTATEPFFSDGKRIVWLITGINIMIFLMWQYAINMRDRKGDASTYIWMRDNFTVGYDGLFQEGRWWTAITSCFSHMNMLHLGVNMVVLHSFYEPVMHVIGVRQFVAMYLIAGVSSCLVSCLYQMYRRYDADRRAHQSIYSRRFPYGLNPMHPPVHSLGASGSISSMALLFAASFPMAPVQVLFVITLPAWVAIGGFAAYDLYQSLRGTQGLVDSAGHIGGASVGLLWWFLAVRGRRFPPY